MKTLPKPGTRVEAFQSKYGTFGVTRPGIVKKVGSMVVVDHSMCTIGSSSASHVVSREDFLANYRVVK